MAHGDTWDIDLRPYGLCRLGPTKGSQGPAHHRLKPTPTYEAVPTPNGPVQLDGLARHTGHIGTRCVPMASVTLESPGQVVATGLCHLRPLLFRPSHQGKTTPRGSWRVHPLPFLFIALLIAPPTLL
ncbi:hypothetical protein L0F63_005525 [Massospora cicadina]|nr:hypothetical protein L0F63_005525 [Massospora cicadina]